MSAEDIVELIKNINDMELIGECPKENAEKAAERLSEIMRNAAYDVPVPFKCDAEIEERWYLNTYMATVQKEYSDFLKKGLSEDEAYHKVAEEHTEKTEQEILDIINAEKA